MRFSSGNISRFLFGSALAAFAAASAPAQDAVMRQGVSIIFSEPANDNVTSNLATLSQKTSGAFKAATDALPISNGRTHYDDGNSPVVIPVNATGVRILPARKDWTEQTPSEILNLATPESVLQISDSDAEALRSLQSSKSSDNGAGFTSRSPAGANVSDNGAPPDLPNAGGGWADLSHTLNVPTTPANSLFDNQNNGIGSTPFNFKTPAPAAQNKNAATFSSSAMSSYQQLLQSASAPSAAQTALPSSPAFSVNQPAPDTTAKSSASFSFGNVSAAQSIGAVPTTLPGLPGLPGRPTLPQPEKPSWSLQPAPWLMTGPQLGVMPQRKF